MILAAVTFFYLYFTVQPRIITEELVSGYDVQALIETYADAVLVDPDLIRAIITIESDFDPQCTSHVGAVGLMQVMPATYKHVRDQYEWSKEDLYDIKTNIKVGSIYYDGLLHHYGSHSRALEAYFGGHKQTPATKRYAAKVLRQYKTYKGGK